MDLLSLRYARIFEVGMSACAVWTSQAALEVAVVNVLYGSSQVSSHAKTPLVNLSVANGQRPCSGLFTPAQF